MDIFTVLKTDHAEPLLPTENLTIFLCCCVLSLLRRSSLLSLRPASYEHQPRSGISRNSRKPIDGEPRRLAANRDRRHVDGLPWLKADGAGSEKTRRKG